MKIIDKDRLLDVRDAAIYLLGCEIHRTIDSGEILVAKIVETESYHQEDPASHTFSGKSERNQAMFGAAGHAYIYFTYGVHWCFNVTAGPTGYGAGVLIRAVEPLTGLETMRELRYSNYSSRKHADLTNGPAKLTQALAIDKKLYGHDLTKPPLQIFEAENRNFKVVETTRIGISRAVDEIARFYIKDTPFISKK
jgi:DNA-3-methyladenine glycosylase